jgi:type II secretory pathway pseudopilin PulG
MHAVVGNTTFGSPHPESVQLHSLPGVEPQERGTPLPPLRPLRAKMNSVHPSLMAASISSFIALFQGRCPWLSSSTLSGSPVNLIVSANAFENLSCRGTFCATVAIRQGELTTMTKTATGRRGGWTLVEIILVMSLVALVATLATVSITRAIQKARKKQAEAYLQILAAAVQQMAWDTGYWPGHTMDRSHSNSDINQEIEDLTTSNAGLLSTDGQFPNWKGPYLDDIPLDPWGTRYFFDPDYTTAKSGVRIVVGSYGPNKVGLNLYDKDDIYVILQ